MQIQIPIGAGELIDRLTILSIKRRRIVDADKLGNVEAHYAALKAVRRARLPDGEQLAELEAELCRVNEALWDIEDALRHCESLGDYGDHFVACARAVYLHNDRRALLKREIDARVGSDIVEEKSYARTPV